jgi:hypothetical protein
MGMPPPSKRQERTTVGVFLVPVPVFAAAVLVLGVASADALVSSLSLVTFLVVFGLASDMVAATCALLLLLLPLLCDDRVINLVGVGGVGGCDPSARALPEEWASRRREKPPAASIRQATNTSLSRARASSKGVEL